MSELMNLPHDGAVPVGEDVTPPDFGGLNEKSHVFCRVYNAHWPKPVRDMMAMPNYVDRVNSAKKICAEYPIDREIMVEGGTGGSPLTCAYGVMLNRLANGFYAVPRLMAGDFDSDPKPFDTRPYQRRDYPDGALKVSINPNDFLPTALDLVTVPRPFSKWRSAGPVDGGVGAEYPALDQNNLNGIGTTWPDPETGQEFMKLAKFPYGVPLIYYQRVK